MLAETDGAIKKSVKVNSVGVTKAATTAVTSQTPAVGVKGILERVDAQAVLDLPPVLSASMSVGAKSGLYRIELDWIHESPEN